MHIKEARLACGYTQEHVANVLGVSRSSYNKYEKGVHEPDIESILKLSNLYDCTTDYLIGKTNNMKAFQLSELEQTYLDQTTNEALLIEALNDGKISCGDRLRGLRQEAGMTIEETAKVFDLVTEFYTEYEQNIRNPDVFTLKKMASFYNCPPKYILGKTTMRYFKNLDNKLNLPFDSFVDKIAMLSPSSREKLRDYIDMLKLSDTANNKANGDLN